MTTRRSARPFAALLALVVITACGSTVPAGPAGAGQPGVITGSGAGPGEGTSSGGGTGLRTVTAPGTSSVGTTGRTAADGSRTGGTGGSGAQQPSSSVSHAGLPSTGRGWTASSVFIGVMEIKDLSTASQDAGIKAIATGDNEAQAHAVADYLNSKGGLFGRKVVIIFDNHDTANVSAQPAVEAQAGCTKFTQDTPVVAVINTNTAFDTPNFRACLAKAQIPLFGVSISPIDDRALADSSGLFFPVIVPTWNRFAPVFAQRLTALHYFTGWDTTAGGPGSAPVKVGAYIHNDPISERAYQLASAAFARQGHAPVDVFRYTNQQDSSNAVLRFRTDGITHVFGLDLKFFLFAVQAESQHYRPRYALHTGNGIGVLMEANVPAAQSVGALGVGTAPSMDINRNPGDITPTGKLCREIMAKNGQTFDYGGLPEAYAFSFCDSMRAAVDAFTAGGGLDATALKAGFARVGGAFGPATTFASALSGNYSVFPGAGIDIGYQQSCSCYNYLNTALRRL